MQHTNMADKEWRSSTRRLHGPGGSSNMSAVLGFGYSDSNPATKTSETRTKDSVVNEHENKTEHESETTEPLKIDSKDEKIDDKTSGLESLDYQSDALKVRQFTQEAGQATPDRPGVAMDCDEVKFIGKMILDEMLELFATVMTPEQSKSELKTMIDSAKSLPKMDEAPNQVHKVIAEQADAFVDIWYYSLNAACKKGINCSKIFEIVHNANMAKRDATTKKFLKRKDGKIIKPKGWKPPNVENEILRQMENGAWVQENQNENQSENQTKKEQ